jgi:hypothetical protein
VVNGGDAHLLETLARALANLGAPAGQDRVMAAQVLKRARQLAAESGTSETEALAGLLAKVVAGRRGDYGLPSSRGSPLPAPSVPDPPRST